ncbi:MAG: SET domain-containing protein-lysine N-methyltransferase [Pseudomonadota bacterium]|nr:SET domain-containing protein-lysine N-methyltransferase [Pseudomonadota bacterium]
MPRSIIVRRSPIHGNGMFAARDLPAEYRLIQYQGRLLTHAQADRRYGGSIESGHTFLFTLNDRYVLDGNEGGNSARWMNHSCEPNCQAVLHEHPGKDRRRDRIFIETLRPVRAGEELVYDYGIVLEVPHTQRLKKLWACRCGTAACTGTLLKPKKRMR